MNKFTQMMKSFLKDEEGLTVVEYVVGAGLLVGGLTVLFSTLGTELAAELTAIIGGIQS